MSACKSAECSRNNTVAGNVCHARESLQVQHRLLSFPIWSRSFPWARASPSKPDRRRRMGGNAKHATHGRCTCVQQTHLGVPGTDMREIASQAQALEAMRRAEQEDDRAKKSEATRREGPNEQDPVEESERRCKRHTQTKVGAKSDYLVLLLFKPGTREKATHGKIKRQGKHRGGVHVCNRSAPTDSIGTN